MSYAEESNLRSPSIAGSLLARLRYWPTWFIALIYLASTAGVLLLKLATPRTVTVSQIFLLPICFVTLARGWRWGVFAACITAQIGFWVDVVRLVPGDSFYIQLWNWSTRCASFIVVAWLLGALRDALRRQSFLARTDPLTGLPNRRAFSERLDQELARLSRDPHPCSLAIVDLDNFKRVNDVLGHDEGDRVLRAAARIYSECVRDIDLVARMGGDEFALLLVDADCPAASAILERIRATWSSEAGKHQWQVSFSIGVATTESAGVLQGKLLAAADEAMYKVKQNGGNGVRSEMICDSAAIPRSLVD